MGKIYQNTRVRHTHIPAFLAIDLLALCVIINVCIQFDVEYFIVQESTMQNTADSGFPKLLTLSTMLTGF